MKVNAKFKININTDLSNKDFKVLTFLYQPLIGIKAYGIYNYLYQLSSFDETHTHQTLFDLLNITQNKFILEREKLEAIGLLETYESNNFNYVYVLKPPYSANKFLKDTFLGTFLESEIGVENIKKLIKMFEVNKENLTSYKNITKMFDDIYEIRSKKLLNINKELEGRNGVNNNLIRNSIDYELLIEKLPRALKSPILFNENFKQKIVQLAFVYDFEVNDLVEILTNASKGNKKLTTKNINLQAKMYFEQNNKRLMVTEKVTDDTKLMDELSYKTIVNKFALDDLVIKANALSTINEFVSQNDINNGVLNVLLIFILKNKEGILPHVNYLNKVWESWHKEGVRTTNDAIKHREYIESSWNNKFVNKNQKTNKPEWLDEYMKELEELEG